ncbi:hypothetical protein TNCV_939491 [Trichonephila clavipes]|nr:hypothetical protein TNCV_939491 [Trichonephila clavipes]
MFHFTANVIEGYERTPNDALQTESVVLWCSETGMIGPVGPPFFPASSVTDSHHSSLVSSNTLTDFSEE